VTLKKQTFSGVLWTFTDVFFVKEILFIAIILLARWIEPDYFGLIGMIAVIVAFLLYKITPLIHKALNVMQIIFTFLVDSFVYFGINYVVKTSPLHQAISLLKTRNL
jgi:hypothetical protein